MLRPAFSYTPPKQSAKSKSKPKLQSDFKTGNMATALVEYTLDMCGKDESKNLRFPAAFYGSYVSELIRSAIALHRCICYANAMRYDPSRRIPAQERADAEAVNLEHLILIAYNKGWISEKQHTQWQKKICDLHFCILNWMSQ